MIFEISELFGDGSSIVSSPVRRRQGDDWWIINYEPGNAKEKFEGKIKGKGTTFYKNGQKLIGNFTCGTFLEPGNGTLVSANGDILMSGTFKEYHGLYFAQEEVKVISGRISEDTFTADGKLYFANNKIYNGIFEISRQSLELVGEGQLINANGEKIEEGISSLRQFTNFDKKKDQYGLYNKDGVQPQYGIYFGKETTGTVSGKIHLTNGKTYKGEFEIQAQEYGNKRSYFHPTNGTLLSYDGTLIQEGKWEDGKFVA